MNADRNQLPVLSRQLESMSHRAEIFQSREQEEQDWFSAVLESLRSTHQMIATGSDLRSLRQDFVLEVTEKLQAGSETGRPPCPRRRGLLEHVFLTMGIELAPGSG